MKKRTLFVFQRILARKRRKENSREVGWKGLEVNIGRDWIELGRVVGSLGNGRARLRGVGNGDLKRVLQIWRRKLQDGSLRRERKCCRIGRRRKKVGVPSVNTQSPVERI